MNPFFEQQWRDAHNSLMTYLRDTLQERLPPDLVARAEEEELEQEVYPVRLRERLPVVQVPLRPTDADVVVDFQPLIDQCHARGRYHLLNYRLGLNPPLRAEDAAWAEQLLLERQLL